MLIHEITLRNLLSFGPNTPPLKMRNLNVLIGPNGSGKSNLIEALRLLHAAPTHLATPVREGGGVQDWIWKGDPRVAASLTVVVDNPQGAQPLRHSIQFTEKSQRFDLVGELIEDATAAPKRSAKMHSFRYEYVGREARSVSADGTQRHFPRDELVSDESILSQLKDSQVYPEITWLGRVYQRMRIYREWSFGPHTALRQPQRTDQQADSLNPDATNLGLVLNRLRRKAPAKQRILEYLRELYDGIEDYDDSVEGGTIQVFFHESGFEMPATRLSDGTLRYLCLLTILCHPKPPPLICIEEPELGLHPDIIPTLAKLLREASERTQLIVTTHSDILVDALSETPESVVVCEKHEGQTSMKRLDGRKLSKWLEKYRLGELWTKGEIGGVRW